MKNPETPQPNTHKSPRRKFLKTSALSGIAAALAPSLHSRAIEVRDNAAQPTRAKTAYHANDVKPFELDEITIADLQDAMKSGKHTARSIAELYLTRIDAIDKSGPTINSVIEINPDALTIADALDKERKEKGPRSRSTVSPS